MFSAVRFHQYLFLRLFECVVIFSMLQFMISLAIPILYIICCPVKDKHKGACLFWFHSDNVAPVLGRQRSQVVKNTDSSAPLLGSNDSLAFYLWCELAASCVTSLRLAFRNNNCTYFTEPLWEPKGFIYLWTLGACLVQCKFFINIIYQYY